MARQAFLNAGLEARTVHCGRRQQHAAVTKASACQGARSKQQQPSLLQQLSLRGLPSTAEALGPAVLATLAAGAGLGAGRRSMPVVAYADAAMPDFQVCIVALRYDSRARAHWKECAIRLLGPAKSLLTPSLHCSHTASTVSS